MKLVRLWDADRRKAYELFMSLPANDHGFENIAWGMDYMQFCRLCEKKRRNSLGYDLPEGFVPDTVHILVDDEGEYVGIFNYRQRLNDFLKAGPGHIGYAIRPDMRGRGYATEGLRLVVMWQSSCLQEEEFYLSCAKDNPASLAVMKKNGGRIDHEDETEYYVRIPRHSYKK